MYKASPTVNISALDKAAVAAVETAADSDFVSIQTQYIRMKNGKAVITNASIPNWPLYDRGRVSFGDVDVTGSPTTATLELLGLDANGIQRSLGTSTFTNGAFPAIEFDIIPEKYYLIVSELAGGTTPAVTVTTLAQGFYRAASTTS